MESLLIIVGFGGIVVFFGCYMLLQEKEIGWYYWLYENDDEISTSIGKPGAGFQKRLLRYDLSTISDELTRKRMLLYRETIMRYTHFGSTGLVVAVICIGLGFMIG